MSNRVEYNDRSLVIDRIQGRTWCIVWVGSFSALMDLLFSSTCSIIMNLVLRSLRVQICFHQSIATSKDSRSKEI